MKLEVAVGEAWQVDSLGATCRPHGLKRLTSRPEIHVAIQYNPVEQSFMLQEEPSYLEMAARRVSEGSRQSRDLSMAAGSNSVNVFLGIGIPWSVGAVPVPQLWLDFLRTSGLVASIQSCQV